MTSLNMQFKIVSTRLRSWFLRCRLEWHTKIFVIKWTRTCHVLCKRPGCNHITSKTHVRNTIFNLSPIHASVIYHIPWIRLIHWKFCSIWKNLHRLHLVGLFLGWMNITGWREHKTTFRKLSDLVCFRIKIELVNEAAETFWTSNTFLGLWPNKCWISLFPAAGHISTRIRQIGINEPWHTSELFILDNSHRGFTVFIVSNLSLHYICTLSIYISVEMTAKEDSDLFEDINWKQTISLEFYFRCQKECHHWRIKNLE